jgi:hypothetical protein
MFVNVANDVKNLTLAAVSNGLALLLQVESETWMKIATAVILPVVFFIGGKGADIMLQLYLAKRKERRSQEEEEGEE